MSRHWLASAYPRTGTWARPVTASLQSLEHVAFWKLKLNESVATGDRRLPLRCPREHWSGEKKEGRSPSCHNVGSSPDSPSAWTPCSPARFLTRQDPTWPQPPAQAWLFLTPPFCRGAFSPSLLRQDLPASGSFHRRLHSFITVTPCDVIPHGCFWCLSLPTPTSLASFLLSPNSLLLSICKAPGTAPTR
jgi:hypothetical protein